MELFRKHYWYTVVTNERYNFAVQKFANTHGSRRSRIHVYCADSNIIYVSFWTKKKLTDIRKLLSKEFAHADKLMVKEYLTFIS